MKVAQALAERADLDKKIGALTSRIKGAARYVEGEEPPESATDMLAEVRSLIGVREALVVRVNLTNARTRLPSGRTVTEAIGHRDRLNQERKLLSEVADSATPANDFFGRTRRRTELPEHTGLPVTDLRAEADRLAKEFRSLDTEIQQSNWDTELF